MTTLLIGPADKTVTVTVQQRTRTAPPDAFRILAPIDLPTVFRPVAPFPGISSVKNQTEAWDHAGSRRSPQFDDGSQVDEELTEYVPGSSFAYQLTGFTNVLSASRPASGASSTSTPTVTAHSSAGPTSSSRCPAAAGSSPAPSLRSGAATWWPPSTSASTSSKQRKTVSRRRSGPGDGPKLRGSSPRTSPPNSYLASHMTGVAF